MTTIALVTSHAPSLVNFRGHLIAKLIKNGLRVLTLAPNHDDSTRKAISDMGAIPIDCLLSRTGLNPIRDIYDSIHLSRLLRRLKVDIVLCYFIKPVIYGTVAAWLARVPRRFAMIEGLGFVFNSGPIAISFRRNLLKKAVLIMYRFALRKARRVIFLNHDDLNELVGSKVLSQERAFHLGGIGVDLNSWIQTSPPLRPVTFVLAARLLKEKGVHEYAEAARLTKIRYPDTRFLLLGSLDKNPGSITLEEVKNWVDKGILDWKGHVSVKPFMNDSSVFVLPSYYREGIPLSIQEAMAVGRAIITTDSPGCRETVVENVNGFLIPVRDAVALAECMQKFIDDPELIIRMGEASRLMAINLFDVHKVNTRILNILLS